MCRDRDYTKWMIKPSIRDAVMKPEKYLKEILNHVSVNRLSNLKG